jgi:polyhydroxyalkanoate synthesis regulator phasin
MKLLPLAALAAIMALPQLALSQESLRADEQVLLKQVMTDRRAVYAANLGLTDSESRAFWPIYDEYEAKVKKVNDRFLDLVNRYVEKYDTLTDEQAKKMLDEKMAIEKERMDLKQHYTKKIEKVLPAKKALRYAQIETRVDNMLRRDVYALIPLAR